MYINKIIAVLIITPIVLMAILALWAALYNFICLICHNFFKFDLTNWLKTKIVKRWNQNKDTQP